MADMDWKKLCAERKAKQLQSIPKEWLITAPPADQRYAQDVPKTCGLLTERELEITETTDVDILLSKLAVGTWTSVEVTLAFYKRAIIAQQLVRSSAFPSQHRHVMIHWLSDELLDGNLC